MNWKIPASQLATPKDTLRVHFAGLMMQGLLASNDLQPLQKIAKLAVEAADALIKELSE